MSQTEKQLLWYLSNRDRISASNKTKTKNKLKIRKICGICKKYFLSDRRDRRYCSTGCSKKADKLRTLTFGKTHKKEKCLYDKLYTKENKERRYITGRRGHLRRKYGISLEDYTFMFNSQNGKCAICDRSGRDLAIDHDHITGKIRGLLCFACNTSLGKFNDDVSVLQRAINYLTIGLAK